MYAIGFTEVLFVLVAFLLFYKFNLNKTFISKLFKGILIYLPLTDQDFEKLIEIKKSKTEKAKGMIRSCAMDEFTQKTKDPNFFNFNFIVTFFLCNIFVVILNEVKNFILVMVNIKELDADFSFNIIASFSFVTFILFVYMYLNDIFKYSFWNYDSKAFYASFIISSVVFYVIELLQPDALGMNLESVNKIVNDRFEKITEKASSHYQMTLSSTENRLRIFYAIIFGLFIGILFKSSMRLAYFDNFLMMTEAKDIKIDKSFNSKRIAFIVKIKLLLNIFILFSLIDTLVKSPLKFIFGKYYLLVYIAMIIISIAVELCLGIYILWYNSFFFHLQVYTQVVSFSSTGNKNNLFSHRYIVNETNSRFWSITLHLFSLIFYPLLLSVILYSRSQLPQYLYERISFKEVYTIKNIEFKVYFFENLIYVITLAFAFTKGVISNANVFYMKATNQLHNSIY